MVYQWKLCSNCLRGGHQSFQCRLSGCRICKRKHNTLLHSQINQSTSSLQQQTQQQIQQPNLQQQAQNEQQNTSTTLITTNPNYIVNSNEIISKEGSTSFISMSAVSTDQALLSTALVKVTYNDTEFILRALLDCGSQSSFISSAAQERIGYPKLKNIIQCVSGINNNTINITEHCNLEITSLHNSFSILVKCFILPIITDKLPHTSMPINTLNIPSNIKLADPKFYKSAQIDLLLGVWDVFWDLIGTGTLKLGSCKPTLQETKLGWIVSGPMGSNINLNSKRIQCNFSQDIKQQLTKFWELEDISSTKMYSKCNEYCENLFTQTTYRDPNGRFVVQIPLRESPDVLGQSYNIAEKRLFQIENKLRKNPSLRQEYNKFIDDYKSLGHLSEVPKPLFGCYLPHHAVIKEHSETTKLRVVFDASAKTTSGKSLNDIQHVGPVVQDDLFSILLRFRQHKYVVSADIEKMYRQILVHPEQRNLQMILWRDHESSPIKIYQLNTVTYGTASAPFLSTRCLLQLSNDCSDPKISKLIKEDFYVDDFLSGGQTKLHLKQIVTSVTNILKSACLPLRKFRTNAPSIFDNDMTTSPKNLDLCLPSSALGLKWNPCKDVFEFPVHIEVAPLVTKRSILSRSAKLFDPLGLLGLCTITPKIILQKLWLTKLDWDDPVEPELERTWNNFVLSLNTFATVQIPRCVIIEEPVIIELHTFSDASQAAYAACVYVRSVDISGNILVRLLCAKTKVAPLKTVTIPRLELCAAHLAARLCDTVKDSLRCNISKLFYWTDSTVLLCWLASQPCELQTFVANRVSEIQDRSPVTAWRHVAGQENPADMASRGLDPKNIKRATLWWNGPTFLKMHPENWPKNYTTTTDVSEKKPYPKSTNCNISTVYTKHITNSTHNSTEPKNLISFDKYSKLLTLQRVLAYVMRFIFNLHNPNAKQVGSLTCEELEMSLNKLTNLHQMECFHNEILLLSSNKNLPNKSNLLSLYPFVDELGILRVGGRIQNSLEIYTRKHPALLEPNHNFTKLLFMHAHKTLLHCGPQLLLNNIRERFWPLRGKNLAKKVVSDCVRCKILRAYNINPIMGNLPAPRVTPSFPFEVSGVDFAGPFHITDRKGRGCKISKCYLCLFICFATKALHLEVASDLTSDMFILCLRRFISRRGMPRELYCDNGTNFVGANNELNSFLKSSNKDTITSFTSNEGIKFKFSPAYSPHFGELWEAGVKSAKFHMTRILESQHLTFEELSTMFSQIEAILNSRPLTPLSTDPNDLSPLTPGHFLIGRSLTSLPSPSLLDVTVNRLNRYQHIEQMRQHFWERWRHEYLSELQQRTKWKVDKEGLQEGDLVALKEANQPPLSWRLGRIHKLYPGSDGVSRVADIRTTKGIIRRAINKICPLITPLNA